MGLIKAIGGAVGGVLADQWREYFYCDALDEDILVQKGRKRTSAVRPTPRARTISFPTARWSPSTTASA